MTEWCWWMSCVCLNALVLAGSNGLGTLLTVTGTGFSSENASIFVGKARCHVEQITGESKKCREENAAPCCWNEPPVCEFSLILSTFLQDTTQVCRLGSASAGTYPVMVSFPSLGNSRYADGNMFHFTYQLVVSSFSPLSGSVAGTWNNLAQMISVSSISNNISIILHKRKGSLKTYTAQQIV